MKDISVWLRNVRKVVERIIEGISGVAKNQQLELDIVEVHETRDVRETTLASARNVEAELTLVDGGDGELVRYLKRHHLQLDWMFLWRNRRCLVRNHERRKIG